MLPMLCEGTFVKLSVKSQKQYHVDCFFLGRFEKDLLHTVLSKAVVLVTRGTVILNFMGDASPIHALCNMERLIDKLTNKEAFICLYKLFIARGLEAKDNYLKGVW